ncbi:MAG: glycerol-3-phosphate 1-O-acyltransferase PlsY [Planctomycetota bacterium]
MTVFLFLIAVLLSYLLGSVPAGYLVAKARGVDLRSVGSGNVGATNVVRAVGKPLGLAVFAFDFLKGFLPAILGAHWLADGGHIPWGRDLVAVSLGLSAVLGHVFPVWLGFRGGKGVATSAGFCAGLAWVAILAALVVWFVTLKLTRYVSVSSIVAAVSFPLIFILTEGPESALHDRRVVTILGVVLAVVIIFLHRANIGRLRRGEEHRVGGTTSGEAKA